MIIAVRKGEGRKDDSMREAPLVRELADTTLKKRSEWAVYDDPNVYGGGA